MRAEQVAVVGDCTDCEDGTMIEETCLEKTGSRRVQLRCQDCDAEGELQHDFEDGLDGAKMSGIENPRMESVNWIDCHRCDGYGEIEDPICDLRRAMNGREHSCPNCHGSGSVPKIVATDGGGRLGDETEQTWLEGTAEGVVATIRGEADELEARDDVDDHLQMVIEQLRHNADELDAAVERNYAERGPHSHQIYELSGNGVCENCKTVASVVRHGHKPVQGQTVKDTDDWVICEYTDPEEVQYNA